MERRKELWFDILTPTQFARGEGNKKSVTRLNVSHSAGGTTVTDSEVGRWKYQLIMLPDLPPAVQAVLTDNAKASTLVKTYMSAALSDSALTAYEVVSNAGAPDISAVHAQVQAEEAPAVTPSVIPAAHQPTLISAPVAPPLSLTLTSKDAKSGAVSSSSTVTAPGK